jgi:hypothetical protein
MVAPGAKLLDLLAAVKKDRHGTLLHHKSVLFYETYVIELETPRELPGLPRPHATGKIYAIFREKRMVAVRTELRIVTDPLPALRTFEPSVWSSVPTFGAETRTLRNTIAALGTFIAEKTHGDSSFACLLFR